MIRSFSKCWQALLITLAITLQYNAYSQYYEPNFLRYHDHIYTENLHTVLLHGDGWELSAPWLELGSSEKLRLSFDDLEADVKNYKFRFIHCSANWQASDLHPADYLDGFYEDFITTYYSSYNTLQAYTHYTIVFPTENMVPRISGNYLLVVFKDNEPDIPLITMRFMIYEPLVGLSGRVHAATDLNDRKYRQEIDFVINQGAYKIEQPYRDMQVIVMQNGRWDNAILGLKPMMVKDNILDFNHEYGNSFDGLNEFRHFDLKSLHVNSDRVAGIYSRSRIFEAVLQPDIPRPYQVYTRQQDINGRRLIHNDNARDSRIESEYVNVSFSLKYETPLAKGDLYVFGGLTYWQFPSGAKMLWDPGRRLYKATLYLKQGYYNYMYALLEDGKTSGDAAFIEGTHEETENDYLILVYNRETGLRYDRLVGLLQLNSLKNR